MYRCNKNVVGKNNKIYYKKGKVYLCEVDSSYPTDGNYQSEALLYGFITNEIGNRHHAWPYCPDKCPMCNDSWTDYFTCLGEKPANVVVLPYAVGEQVKWWCDDDTKVHSSKLSKAEIEIDKYGISTVQYGCNIKFKNTVSDAVVSVENILRANPLK